MIFGWLRRKKKPIEKKRLYEKDLESENFGYVFVEEVTYENRPNLRIDLVHAIFKSNQGDQSFWFDDKHRISMTRNDFLAFRDAIIKIEI